MHILISGVNGFIGGDLFTFLQNFNPGFTPVGIGRKPGGESPCYFSVDLADKNSVESFIAKMKTAAQPFDAFVHCAAVLADADNNKDPELFFTNNRVTEHVIRVMTELNIPKLINLSTIGVYPNTDGEYDEHSAVQPSKNFECLYSLSKFCSEELFNFYLARGDCNVVNLRLSQVYGKRMREDRIFKIMELEMKATGKISVWANGERVSNFVGIDHVLKTILHFLQSDVSGLFNVGGENLSYKQLAEKVILSNNAENVEICLVNKGVASRVYINSNRLKKELG